MTHFVFQVPLLSLGIMISDIFFDSLNQNRLYFIDLPPDLTKDEACLGLGFIVQIQFLFCYWSGIMLVGLP